MRPVDAGNTLIGFVDVLCLREDNRDLGGGVREGNRQ